ncbi:hypothetical protein K437DRAFT_253366 [Tilletiaria anomala UBC 951]|uniref:Uncharacterized protein n=1 Tax=Tilletiaria anomala (strain ATCC 24038 / CBS 436.72 / UBC 951) TaxID=1037660 RepID=A0A066WGD3_TILAU|nr:uncharacterized protein K437DRAFT_253366 [Tilletiaria anomala UBC 951]KDN53042.1 hypothetical protein K437DRAFT_253366 [Tilletiaria anomala UBC 951]
MAPKADPVPGIGCIQAGNTFPFHLVPSALLPQRERVPVVSASVARGPNTKLGTISSPFNQFTYLNPPVLCSYQPAKLSTASTRNQQHATPEIFEAKSLRAFAMGADS